MIGAVYAALPNLSEKANLKDKTTEAFPTYQKLGHFMKAKNNYYDENERYH